MFQFGMDDEEQPEGLAAGLLGTKPNSMPDFGLGAMLSQMPNSGSVSIAAEDPAQGGDAKNGDNAIDAGKLQVAPASDPSTGEWDKMLAQLYEAGKFKSGYLSKIFGSVDYANLSAESLNSTFTVGLRDIEFYEEDPFNDHQPDQQGSVIDWRQVDWSKYGAAEGVPPETVMRRFLTSALNSGD